MKSRLMSLTRSHSCDEHQAVCETAGGFFRDLLDGKVPSDLALLQDAEIRQYVEQYATDQVNTLCLLNPWGDTPANKD